MTPPAPAPAAAASSPAPGALGVLSIVLGAIVALSELVDLVRVVLTGDRATTDLLGGVGVEMKAAAPYVGLRAAVMLLMSLALVVVGVGLKLRRPHARVPILGDLTSSFLELAHVFEYAILVVLLAYPVVLLAILSRRSVREAMRG